MLIPIQFADSQMESAGISAKVAANKPKMPFCANPVTGNTVQTQI
jgi:hypothetical protein